jgi:cathepsin A (carboxypeptidase C)
VGNDNKTHHNPYGWNNNANVFFVDQPIGVGFSYADHGEFVVCSNISRVQLYNNFLMQSSTEEAAVDMAAFVFIFFEHFSQFKGRPFHFSGESYAGRYLPVFASALYDLNTKMVKAGHTAVNLSSVMIGMIERHNYRVYILLTANREWMDGFSNNGAQLL